jgi:2-polyprenyl-3-methyl-5-hydroxy-6-metoxy-1,4-benzoquinol methylase
MLTDVQRDFDRIAFLPESSWNVNSQYHSYLLRALPARVGLALDVGCGTGAFTGLLADRSDSVIAIDISPNMIQVARSRLQGVLNIHFRTEDFLASDLPAASFDCVSAIAVMHHSDPEAFLAKVSGLLRPGGVLLLIDLYAARTLVDYLVAASAVVVSPMLRMVHTGKTRAERSVRDAWREHGQRDRYPTLRNVSQLASRLLPNATLRRHLLWRYSLVWKKPIDNSNTRT